MDGSKFDYLLRQVKDQSTREALALEIARAEMNHKETDPLGNLKDLFDTVLREEAHPKEIIIL